MTWQPARGASRLFISRRYRAPRASCLRNLHNVPAALSLDTRVASPQSNCTSAGQGRRLHFIESSFLSWNWVAAFISVFLQVRGCRVKPCLSFVPERLMQTAGCL